MLKTKNFGRSSLTEMKEILNGMGANIWDETPKFPER